MAPKKNKEPNFEDTMGEWKRRRLSFQKSLTASPEAQQSRTQKIDLSELLRKKWKVFRVSPLFDFDITKLKKYGKKLSEDLAIANAMSRKSCVYKSTFTAAPKLQRSSESRSGVQIEVTSDSYLKPCYVGYLLSWNKNEPQSLSLSRLSSLPVLLVRSSKTMWMQVHKILCKFFDCDIQEITLKLNDLMKFLCFLVNIPREKSALTSEVTLLYEIPVIPPKDRIIVNLPLEEAALVLLSIKRSLMQQDLQDIQLLIHGYYTTLLKQIFDTYKLDLMKARLFRVKLHGADVYSDGQVYWADTKCADISLEIFNELSILLESDCPSMARDIS